MTKKDIILLFIGIIISGVWLIYCIIHPITNYTEIPIEQRIRYEQRMIGW